MSLEPPIFTPPEDLPDHTLCPLPQCVELLSRIDERLSMFEKFFGNGVPGWKQQTERRLVRLERTLWILTGVGLCAGYLIEKIVYLWPKMH